MAILAASLLALSAGGCSYRLGGDSLAGSSAESSEHTASVPTPAKSTVWAPLEADIAIAKAAVVELFTRGSKDSSLPWENPRTGARGTITPLASAYTQDGNLCRDFLASYLRDQRESWFQGGACRKDARWHVRDMRPLQRQ